MERLSELQPQDSRHYFMLPQAPEDAGYYVYGTPAGGAVPVCPSVDDDNASLG